MVTKSICIILVVCMFSLVGCMTHIHKVGNGAQSNTSTSKKQWYVLFGLIPLNTVETQQMAAGATDYDIKTQTTFVDIVISIFTGAVSVNLRTVTVKK